MVLEWYVLESFLVYETGSESTYVHVMLAWQPTDMPLFVSILCAERQIGLRACVHMLAHLCVY